MFYYEQTSENYAIKHKLSEEVEIVVGIVFFEAIAKIIVSRLNEMEQEISL